MGKFSDNHADVMHINKVTICFIELHNTKQDVVRKFLECIYFIHFVRMKLMYTSFDQLTCHSQIISLDEIYLHIFIDGYNLLLFSIILNVRIHSQKSCSLRKNETKRIFCCGRRVWTAFGTANSKISCNKSAIFCDTQIQQTLPNNYY